MKVLLIGSLFLNTAFIWFVLRDQPIVVPTKEKIVYVQKIIPLTQIIKKEVQVEVEKIVYVKECSLKEPSIAFPKVELEPPQLLKKDNPQSYHRVVFMLGAGYGVVDKTLKPRDDETFIFSKKMGMVYQGQILYSPKGSKVWYGIEATTNQNYVLNLGWEFDF